MCLKIINIMITLCAILRILHLCHSSYLRKNLNWLMFSSQHLKMLFNRNIIYIETICFDGIINEIEKNFVSKAFCFSNHVNEINIPHILITNS